MWQQVLAGRTRQLGAEHPDTLAAAFALAQLSERQQAVELYERVLEGRERVLGPDHPHTLTTATNLAQKYDTERKPEANALLRRV
ncbi:MAG: tetratricopeptide repeat protein, partial [Actinomycetota bacterium]|nr:tetratricopeptide repeat protein [Actinomycetota bacterium]